MDNQQILQIIIPFIGALAFTYLFYVAIKKGYTTFFASSGERRVAEIMGGAEEERVEFGSEPYRLRLAFAKVGINVAGQEVFATQVARVVVGIAAFLILYFLVGLPIIPSAMGFVGGWMIINGVIGSAWKNTIKAMEEELPFFVIGFSSTIQVTSNVLQAVEDETQALDANSPLKEWLLTRFVKPCHDQGNAYVPIAVKEGDALSPSLGVVTYLMGRVWEVGGAEWQRAFERASSNVEATLEARSLAQSTADGVRGSVLVIAAINAIVMVMMIRNPAVSGVMNGPLVQIGYGVVILFMIFGWFMINDIVENIG